jgi:hypothetical protein
MRQFRTLTQVAAIVVGCVVAAQSAPADACGRWHACARERAPVQHYRYYRDRSYDSGVRYYRSNPCTYGDCACIRRYALSTGSQVWWDRYQACTG